MLEKHDEAESEEEAAELPDAAILDPAFDGERAEAVDGGLQQLARQQVSLALAEQPHEVLVGDRRDEHSQHVHHEDDVQDRSLL